jgi:hypothetical protein
MSESAARAAIKAAGVGSKVEIQNYDGMVFVGYIREITKDNVTIQERGLDYETEIAYRDIEMTIKVG